MFVSLAIRVTAKSSQLFQGFAYPQFSSPQDPSSHALWSRVLGLGVGFSLGKGGGGAVVCVPGLVGVERGVSIIPWQGGKGTGL